MDRQCTLRDSVSAGRLSQKCRQLQEATAGGRDPNLRPGLPLFLSWETAGAFQSELLLCPGAARHIPRCAKGALKGAGRMPAGRLSLHSECSGRSRHCGTPPEANYSDQGVHTGRPTVRPQHQTPDDSGKWLYDLVMTEGSGPKTRLVRVTASGVY